MSAESKLRRSRWTIEKEEDWMGWTRKIPALQVDKDWTIQVIPPFAGAMVRFIIQCGDTRVSVYLDCFGRLGAMNRPYWEVYPHDGDVYRCYLGETDLLIAAIRESIDQQNKGTDV